MSQQGLLPKFGPKKRENVARGDEAARRDPSSRQSAGDGKENLGEGTGDRTDAGCSLKSESSWKPQGNAESGWLRGWWQKLFRRRPRREHREPVQAEFGLDLVRVVRNDLSDAEETKNAERGTRKKEKAGTAEEPAREESVFGATRG